MMLRILTWACFVGAAANVGFYFVGHHWYSLLSAAFAFAAGVYAALAPPRLNR